MSEAISILKHTLLKPIMPINLSESQIENTEKNVLSAQQTKENLTH